MTPPLKKELEASEPNTLVEYMVILHLYMTL